MSWLSRQFEKRALVYAGVPLQDPALTQLFSIPGSNAGVHVDEDNVTSLSAYFSGVNLIASTLALVRFEVVKKMPKGGLEIVEDHITSRLMDIAPNQNMTSYSLIDMTQRDVVTWGNGYIYIERGDDDRPIALWPLPAAQMDVLQNASNGELTYKFRKKYAGEEDKVYKACDVVHIPGYGFNGVKGFSLVKYARNSLSIGVATDTYGASFFANDAQPGTVIETEKQLDLDAKQRIVSDYEDMTRGPFKARKTVILDEGMKQRTNQVSNEAAQFLDTRKYQNNEVSRLLRVPPQKMYNVDTIVAGSEAEDRNFVVGTMRPWAEKWAQELTRKLLSTAEQKKHSFRFKDNGNALITPDIGDRFEAYSRGRNSLSIYTINDIRIKEGMSRLDDSIADTLIAPTTMRILGGSDPSTPIHPDVVVASFTLLASFKEKVSLQFAKSLMNATMPGASDEFVNAMLAEFKKNEYIVEEPAAAKGMVEE